MKIVCDNCTTKYQIADEKVSGKAFKIRCKKCGHVIVVNKNAGDAGATQPPQADAGAPAEAAPPAAEPAPASDAVWHLVIDREQVGPMTAEEVKAKIRGGQVDGDTYGWKEGFEDWLKLSAIDNFKDEFANKPSDDQATRRAEQATVLQSAPQAAAPGADLFAAAPAQGQAQRAASPAAPTLMSADAGQMAVAGRAAEPPMSSGQESEALGSGKGMKGARSENSVLFSLNNLSALAGDSGGGGGGGGGGRSAPAPSADKPGYANAQSEASGLIDIRAMAAATLSSNNQGGPGMSRGPDMLMGSDIAPVFAPVATNMLMPSNEPQGIPKWVFALVGVGGLAIIGMIVFLVIYLQSPPAPGPVATGTTTGTTAATTGTPTGPGPATTPETGPATKPAATGTPSTASTPTPPTKSGSDSSSRDSGSSGSSKHKSERADKSERSSKSTKDAPAAKAEKEPEIPAPKAETPAPKKEKPAKAKDDLDSLLDSASAGSGGKPKAQEKKDLPDQLSRDQISGGFKGVNLGSCKGEGASGTYMVKLTIGRNGRVSDASVSSGGEGKDCVAKAVKSAHFPEFSGDPMSLTYPFIVR